MIMLVLSDIPQNTEYDKFLVVQEAYWSILAILGSAPVFTAHLQQALSGG